MTRSLRILKPVTPAEAANPRAGAATGMFWWAVLALLLQFIFPYVVLQAMGVNVTALKEHPSTILVIIGGIYVLARGVVPFHQRCREQPGLLLFVFAIPVLNIYSAYFTGVSGAALYAESYWSAGMLALMLGTASPRQKRILARILITICVINVLIALYESATTTNWFPLVIDPDAPLLDSDVDFRANAFFNHPLTASLITSMAIFLLFAMRMRFIFKAPTFLLLLIGLFAYGGRTALGVTLILTVLVALYILFSGVIRRNLNLEFILIMASAVIVIPIVVAFIVTQTSIADRIMDTLYIDGSAETRATQWEVFKYLSLRHWLFGITHSDLDVLKYQIGLGGKETDIENFWFLMLLNLGGIGFLVFLVTFGIFLVHLGRYTNNLYGWLLVVAALIIDSGSNSLGSKSSDLFCEVAFMIAMSGYREYSPQPRLMFNAIRNRLNPTDRIVGVLGEGPASKSRGLRILGSRPV